MDDIKLAKMKGKKHFDEDSATENEDLSLLSPCVAKRSCRTKPKVVESWTDEDIFKLITNVESHPCVWNAADKNFSDKMNRKNAWISISDQLKKKYSEKQLDAKWINMRIQYRSYAARAKNSSRQGAKYLPKWKYFKAMSFVDRGGTMSFVDNSETAQKSGSNSNVSLDDSNDSSSTCQIPTSSSRRPIAPALSTIPSSSSSIVVETMREPEVVSIREQKEDHRNIAFTNYILSEIRALSESEANLLRTRLQRTLLEFTEEIQSRQMQDL